MFFFHDWILPIFTFFFFNCTQAICIYIYIYIVVWWIERVGENLKIKIKERKNYFCNLVKNRIEEQKNREKMNINFGSIDTLASKVVNRAGDCSELGDCEIYPLHRHLFTEVCSFFALSLSQLFRCYAVWNPKSVKKKFCSRWWWCFIESNTFSTKKLWRNKTFSSQIKLKKNSKNISFIIIKQLKLHLETKISKFNFINFYNSLVLKHYIYIVIWISWNKI